MKTVVYLIPVVNIVIAIMVVNQLCLSFGKDSAFTVGLIFLSFIFYPILGLDEARYIGPGGNPMAISIALPAIKGYHYLCTKYKPMIQGQKVVVVLPAYNAELTLKMTYDEIPFDLVDEVILVDDASKDKTIEVGKALGIRHIIKHEKNKGYGGNQKSCYDKAIEIGGDIIVMLHPDYQYTPKLIAAMVHVIASGLYPVIFASRILGKGALRGGMPMYKYIANRFLTLSQNMLMGQKLSEYHTGYRAYRRTVLQSIDYHLNSNDFVFDNEITAQIFYAGFEVAEVTCPTKYFEEASSINFKRSVKYGLGVLATSFKYFLQKRGLGKYKIFSFKK